MNYAPNQYLETPLSPDQAIMYESGKKSVGLAILFGFIFYGGGQLYAGKISRGVIIWASAVVLVILSFFLIGIPFLIALVIWSLFDAKACVEEYNRVHLARITSGQVYRPGVAYPGLTQPPTAPQPVEPNPLMTAPPPPANTEPPPPSSETPVVAAQPAASLPSQTPAAEYTPPQPPTGDSSNRITLTEDDF